MTYSWRERRGKTLHRLLIFEDESIGWLWLIVDISIVKGYIYISYKPSYITWGASPCNSTTVSILFACLAISLLYFVRSKAFSWKMSWRTSKPWIDMIEMVHIHDFSDPCPRYLTEFLGTPRQGSAFPMFLFKYEYHVRIPQFYGKLMGLRPWVSGSPIFRGPVINAKESRDLITAKTHSPVISSITPHQLVASTGLIVYTVYIYISLIYIYIHVFVRENSKNPKNFCWWNRRFSPFNLRAVEPRTQAWHTITWSTGRRPLRCR